MWKLKCVLQRRFVLSVLLSTNISFGNWTRESLSDYYSMTVFLVVIAPLKITLQKVTFKQRQLMIDYLVTALHKGS